jgi:hypothetical protein
MINMTGGVIVLLECNKFAALRAVEVCGESVFADCGIGVGGRIA